MAAYSIAISNSLRVWGPAEPDKWGAYNWNAFIWGEGTAGTVQSVGKSLAEGISVSESVSLAASFYLVISNDIQPIADMGSERLYDAAGYSRVFPGNTTEGESRVSSTWSVGTAGSSTWTSGTATSTTWSQA